MPSTAPLEELPAVEHSPGSPAESIDEKADVKVALEKQASSESIDTDSKVEGGKDYYDGDEKVVLVNGEPVITTGRDVSRFLIDTRDDGDPAITFRSLFIGTVFAGLGAALCQVRVRPPEMGFAFNGAIFRLNLVVDAIFVRFRSTCSSRSKCRSPRSSFSS